MSDHVMVSAPLGYGSLAGLLTLPSECQVYLQLSRRVKRIELHWATFLWRIRHPYEAICEMGDECGMPIPTIRSLAKVTVKRCPQT